jgi:hypothetical protein
MASQVVQIAFQGGIDEKEAAEWVDPTTRALQAQNVTFTHDGSLEKRFGMQQLPSAQRAGDPTMGNATRVMSHEQETLASDGDGLYAFSPSLQQWVYRSNVPECVATRMHLLNNSSNYTGFSISEGGGYRAVAYRTWASGATTAGTVYFSLYDTVNGSTLLSNYQVTLSNSYNNPICMIVGGHAYVIFGDTSNNIYGIVLTLATLTWSGITTIASNSNTVFDAVPEDGGNGILIFYSALIAGIYNARYLRLESLPALTITSFGTTASYAYPIELVSCRYDAANMIAFFWNTDNGGTFTHYVAAYTPAWVSISTTTVTLPGLTGEATELSVCPLSPTTFAIFGAIKFSTYPGTQCATATYNTAGASLTSSPMPLGLFAGRPFTATVGGKLRCYIPFVSWQQDTATSPAFGTLLLLDSQSVNYTGYAQARPAAVVGPRQCASTYFLLGMLLDGRPCTTTNTSNPTAGVYRTLIVVNSSEEFINQTTNTGSTPTVFLDEVTFDFTQSTTMQFCEGQDETFISGGLTGYYDGVIDAELSFLSWPNLAAATTNVNSGGLLSSGNYQYAYCYAQPDANGLIHRSAFYTEQVASGATGTTTITFNNLPYTSRYAAGPNAVPVIEVYRTQVNATTLYYIGSIPTDPTNLASTHIYTDTLSDTSITSNTLMYTTGGVLDSVCAPSSQCMIRHVERLWIIDDTGFVVWYTTTFGGGPESGDAPYFNESLTLQFSDEPLTALASMDGNLVVFSSKSIWYVSGQGPNALGQGSDLTTATLIPSDVGASGWSGTCAFPGGVLFQAPNFGIYLLDRGFNVSFIGRAVQDITAGVSVVGATLVASHNEIRLLLGGSFSVLVYNYVTGQWSTNEYANIATCSAITNGAWTACLSSNGVWEEKTTAAALPWYDTTSGGSNSWVSSSLQLAYFKPGGLQGWASLEFIQGLATTLDYFDIVMRLVYNYGSAVETRTFTAASLFVNNNVMSQWRFSPSGANQQIQSVSVLLSDAAPTGKAAVSGQGPRWLGLAFKFSTLGGVYDNLSPGVKQ